MAKIADATIAEFLDRARTEKMPELADSLGIGRTMAYRLINQHGHRCQKCRQVIRPAKTKPRKKFLRNGVLLMVTSQPTRI